MTTEKTILETIDRESTSHVGALEDALDAGAVVVDQRCFDLQRKGLLRPVGAGRYRLTPSGKRRLRRLHSLNK